MTLTSARVSIPDTADESALLLAEIDDLLAAILVNASRHDAACNNEQLHAAKELQARIGEYLNKGYDPQEIVARVALSLPSDVIDMMNHLVAECSQERAMA